jgi:hypothetical protein
MTTKHYILKSEKDWEFPIGVLQISGVTTVPVKALLEDVLSEQLGVPNIDLSLINLQDVSLSTGGSFVFDEIEYFLIPIQLYTREFN